MIFGQVYLLLVLTLPLISSDYVICEGSKDIWVNVNEIIFFETVNFPMPLLHNCSLTISTVTDEPIRMRLYLSFWSKSLLSYINDNHTQIVINDNSYITSSSSIQLFLSTHCSGSIVVEKALNFTCHLTALSQPFTFTDEGQALNLFPWYIDSLKPISTNFTCQWTFLGPKDYGFKVVFTKYSDASFNAGEIMIIRNSTNYVIADLYAQEYQPYYNDDRNITISYTSGLQPYGFQAYVTVVKKNPEIVDGNCIHNDEFWGNTMGALEDWYPNNARCDYLFEVPPNQMVLIKDDIMIVEKGVDKVVYFIDDDDDYIYEISEGDSIKVLQAPLYKSLPINFTFISDGSIPNTGFSMILDLLECKCSAEEIILPCGEGDFYLFDIMESPLYHCANLTCNFRLSIKCSDWHIGVTFLKDDYDCSQDNYTLKSDNEVILTQCDGLPYPEEKQFGIISTSQKGYLNFSSGPLANSGTLSARLWSMKPPEVLPTRILTKEAPLIFIDMAYDVRENSQFTIKFAPELLNDEIEIFGLKNFIAYFVLFYQYENLTGFLGNGNVESLTINNSVTFYIGRDLSELDNDLYRNAVITVRAKKAQTQNCMFEGTVLDGKTKQKITALATDEGDCEVAILMVDFLVIDNVWTDSKIATVKVFTDVDKNHRLFEFNQSSSAIWKVITLSVNFLIVQIPKNANVYIEIKQLQDYGSAYSPPVYEISKPIKSLIYVDTNDLVSLIYQIRNISTNFTITEWIPLTVTEPPIPLNVYFNDSKIPAKLAGLNDSLHFYSADVKVTTDACTNYCTYGFVKLYINAS